MNSNGSPRPRCGGSPLNSLSPEGWTGGGRRPNGAWVPSCCQRGRFPTSTPTPWVVSSGPNWTVWLLRAEEPRSDSTRVLPSLPGAPQPVPGRVVLPMPGFDVVGVEAERRGVGDEPAIDRRGAHAFG